LAKEEAMAKATEVATTQKVVRADGIELATEAFGDPAHAPVLLVMGATASMLWWPDEFCRRLAAQDRYVIRYDNRDTGLSTTWEPGNPGYTFADMADDVVRVIDGYGLSAAHIAGMSMGGLIVQLAALDHPERVLSLTAISTSPTGVDTSHLPQTTQAYQEHAEQGAGVDWTDREQVVRYTAKDVQMLAGPSHAIDEAAARAFVGRDFDRARRFASATNHFILDGGRKSDNRLPDLRMPLLVIHGTADPIFPIEHGEAFLEVVPGSTLVRIDGGGHELHETDWSRIIAAIVEHTREKT
jgi:pimeloyl-ACP methyl ester carboxylesterase